MTSLFDLPFEDDPSPDPADPVGPNERLASSGRSDGAQGLERLGDAPQDPEPAPPHAPRIYSVREITAAVRSRLEDAFPVVWIEGELFECRSWQSGHVYFTLKDGDAQLQGVLFRTDAVRLRFKPTPGLHVLVRGRLSIYPAKGQYQIVAETMEPRGAGALQVAFDQLKRRLQAEGLFDQARKRPLPMLPRRVGVVTSLDGAALRDVLRVLRTRRAPVGVVVSPTRVQGEGAARDIARALRRVAAVDGVDVVIVGRGGGSAEDLWAFNEEIVARVIVACPVPVISAVGHEIDATIADFAADVRAATPSQAAEMVVRQASEFSARLDTCASRLVLHLRRRLDERRVALLRLEQRPALAHVRDRVTAHDRTRHELTQAMADALRAAQDTRRRRLHDITARLTNQHPRTRLTNRLRRLVAFDQRLADAGVATARARARALQHTTVALAEAGPSSRMPSLRRTVDLLGARLGSAIQGRRHRGETGVRELAGRLENLSPLRTLARGYAACWDATHTRLLRSSREVASGAAVHVQLADGQLHCRVEQTSPPTDDTP